jgi:hypothetical protein
MAAFHWSSDDGWLVALMPVSLPAGSRQRQLPDGTAVNRMGRTTPIQQTPTSRST